MREELFVPNIAICILSWDGPGTRDGRTSLAVVAYREGQLYCICTMSWDGPGTRDGRTSLAVVAYREG